MLYHQPGIRLAIACEWATFNWLMGGSVCTSPGSALPDRGIPPEFPFLCFPSHASQLSLAVVINNNPLH